MNLWYSLDIESNLDIESFCEEIAASILYNKNKEEFIDINDFFGEEVLGFQEPECSLHKKYKCTTNTKIYHYCDNNLFFKNMTKEGRRKFKKIFIKYDYFNPATVLKM